MGKRMGDEQEEPIADFVRALQAHGAGSPEAEKIRSAHVGDAVFVKRAETAELLFRNKDRVLAELRRLEQGAAHPAGPKD